MTRKIDAARREYDEDKEFGKIKSAEYFIMDMSAYHDRSRLGTQEMLRHDDIYNFEATSALAVAMLLADGKKIIGIEFPDQCKEDSPFVSYIEGLMDHIVVFSTMPKNHAELRDGVFDFLEQEYNYRGEGMVAFVFNAKNESRYGNNI